jgi:hypothetical protein
MNIVMSDWGIGDVICSLYAIQGFANRHTKNNISLYIRQHMDWANLADIPQMTVKIFKETGQIAEPVFLYDDKKDFDKILKHSNSPKLLFSSALGVEPAIPNIKKEISISCNPRKRKYIVLAPFATRVNRTWEIHNWRILADNLKLNGYDVIALDGPYTGGRCSTLGVEYFWGQSAIWTAIHCLHAELIITNDSGLAHLGGWLGTKTLVIMSQLNPSQFYDLTGNRFIQPTHNCVGCKFIEQNGYEDKCNYGCWTLQSISPKIVLTKSLEWMVDGNTQ